MFDDVRQEVIDALSQKIFRRVISYDHEGEALSALRRLVARLKEKNIPLHSLILTAETAQRQKATSLEDAQDRIDRLKEERDFYRENVTPEIARSYRIQEDWTDEFADFYDLVCVYFGRTPLLHRWRRKLAPVLGVDTSEIDEWERGDPIPDRVMEEMRRLAMEHAPQEVERRILIARIIRDEVSRDELIRHKETNRQKTRPCRAEQEAILVLIDMGFDAIEIATILQIPIAAVPLEPEKPRPAKAKNQPKRLKEEPVIVVKTSPLRPTGVRPRGDAMDSEEFWRIINRLGRPDRLRRITAVSNGTFRYWIKRNAPPLQTWAEVFRRVYQQLESGNEVSEEWVDQIKIEEGLPAKRRNTKEVFKPIKQQLLLS